MNATSIQPLTQQSMCALMWPTTANKHRNQKEIRKQGQIEESIARSTSIYIYKLELSAQIEIEYHLGVVWNIRLSMFHV